MNLIRTLLSKHGRLVLLTFELFWIGVFLLERVSSGGGSGIPQFVYVNF